MKNSTFETYLLDHQVEEAASEQTYNSQMNYSREDYPEGFFTEL